LWLEKAMFTGDSSFVRELIDLYLTDDPADPDPDRFDFMHWAIYSWLGDTTQLARFRQHAEGLPDYSLQWAVHLGFPMDDVEYYFRRDREEAVTMRERYGALGQLRRIVLIQGRVFDVMAFADSFPPRWNNTDLVLGFTPRHVIKLAVAEQVGEYQRLADSAALLTKSWLPDRLRVGSLEDPEYIEIDKLCHSELWRVARGDTSGTRRRIQELRTRYADVEPLYWHECPLLLEALLADGTAQADETLERLDEYMKQGPPAEIFANLANLIIARLHSRRGNTEGALAAARRRRPSGWSVWLVPAYLREECLSARAAGDPAGGIRACNHYLTLRPDPPTVQPLLEQWEQVRAELAVLVGEREGRER
jgi:hypothetical protein